MASSVPRSVLLFVVGAAVAVLAMAALFLLGGPVQQPAPPAPPPPPARPGRKHAPPTAPAPGEGETPAPPGTPPGLPPDAYPFDPPAWWDGVDRKFREKQVRMEETSATFEEVLGVLSRAAGFPARAGPELEAWAKETDVHLKAVDATARGLVEALALAHNLEVVLTEDALVFHQRGRAPDTREVRAGRVRWALLEGKERRAGVRPRDPTYDEVRADEVDLGFDKVPLRDAGATLSRRLGIPVFLDGDLWRANPVLDVPARPRTLGDLLDLLAAAVGASWDATSRRVVVFRP